MARIRRRRTWRPAVTEERAATPSPALPNATPRRSHVTLAEAKRIFDAAGQAGRNGVRDRALLMVTYWHGLRAGEAVALQWHDIEWTTESVYVHRSKGGISGTHPLQGEELRALRALRRECEGNTGHVFLSERRAPLSVDMLARIIARAGVIAGIGLHVHPHMLRHGAGYRLANKGTDTRTIQAYLGHRQISSTVRYTALAPDRFKHIHRE